MTTNKFHLPIVKRQFGIVIEHKHTNINIYATCIDSFFPCDSSKQYDVDHIDGDSTNHIDGDSTNHYLNNLQRLHPREHLKKTKLQIAHGASRKNGKSVTCCDDDGIDINTFPSAKIALDHYSKTKVKGNLISQSIERGTKAFGFHWY